MLFEQLQRKSVKYIREEEKFFLIIFIPVYTVTLGKRYNFNVRKVMICHVVYTNVLQHFATILHAGL